MGTDSSGLEKSAFRANFQGIILLSKLKSLETKSLAEVQSDLTAVTALVLVTQD